MRNIVIVQNISCNKKTCDFNIENYIFDIYTFARISMCMAIAHKVRWCFIVACSKLLPHYYHVIVLPFILKL